VNSFSIVSDYGKNYTSKGTLNNQTYTEYIASEDGKALMESGVDGLWSGYHTFIDQKANVSSDDYCLSYTRSFIKGNGFLIIDVKMDKVKESLEKINFGQGSTAFFITGDGRETILGDNGKMNISQADYYKVALQGEETSGFRYINIDGQQQLFIYTKIGDTNSMVGCLIPKGMILKQASSIKNSTVIVVVIACLVAILVGTAMAAGIGRAIARMQKALSKASQGDLTVSIDMKRRDEFQSLSSSILNMIRNMKESIIKTAQVGMEVTHSTKEVEGVSKQLLATSEDIQSAINEIESGAVMQAEEAAKCLAQMQNLTEKILLVQENAGQIDLFSKDTRQIIHQGIDTVADLERKANETTSITEEVIGGIEELAVASRSIEGIVVLMNEIAEQTSLLSLNASIEAARAGEAGRGFAVVAEEIRKLADQSQQSANRIGSIVSSIHRQTQSIVHTTQRAKQIVLSQGDSLRDTIHVFNRMNQNVEQLSGNLETIGTGVAGVELAKEDTLHSIENISAVSEETAAASEQVSRIADSQLLVAEQLNGYAEALSENTKRLEDAIGIFHV
jgi:methyl-accepting chemotaxis protein